MFFNGRLFESHPLTIANAPPSTSILGSRSLTLAARVRGDWTRALNAFAQDEQARYEADQALLFRHRLHGQPLESWTMEVSSNMPLGAGEAAVTT